MRVWTREPHLLYRWQRYVHDHLATNNCIVAGRQKGKTELACEVGYSIIESEKIVNPRWILCSDEIGRLFRIYSGRLNQYFRNNEHFNWRRETETSFRVPRVFGDHITIEVHGAAHNFSSAKGGSNHYVLADEYGKTAAMYAEEVLFPTTAATNGISFITGSVEDNFWYDLFTKAKTKMDEGDEEWFAFFTSLGDDWCKRDFSDEWRARQSSRFDLKNPNDLRIWNKEYLCDWFASSQGKIFTRSYHFSYMSGKMGKFSYDSSYKVGFTLDNGHNTAVWFYQLKGGKCYLIDYREYVELGIDEIAKDIKGWYSEKSAELDNMIFPHTMKRRSQEAGMRCGAEVFLDAWGEIDLSKVLVVPRVANIELKISATRKLIAESYFNFTACSLGLRSVRNYKRKVVVRKGIVSNEIDKEGSHGAEALGELALCIDNNVIDMLNSKRKQSVKNQSSAIITNLTLERLEKKAQGLKRGFGAKGAFKGY